GERVTYNGLPMQVRSINVDSLLRNPDLKGIVRLPLSMLNDMVSRPDINEPWFPCHAGEYVILPDGRFCQVLEQTLDLVSLQMKGSLVQFPAADFFRLDLLNLSRQGFVVVVTFGIDYQHQAQCLDEVPARLREALEHALAQAEFSDKIVDLLVEFKEPSTNSLDYLIVVNCKGEAADSYFTINRLIQKTCVEVCNRGGWIIPFTQLTVHQGEGLQALSERLTQSYN
ncbi:MAG: mechanosensitive ion channel, partial [Nitrosomonas sp.]|nr:mechanosensitive ion channel [Nitrosomonas sp.]